MHWHVVIGRERERTVVNTYALHFADHEPGRLYVKKIFTTNDNWTVFRNTQRAAWLMGCEQDPCEQKDDIQEQLDIVFPEVK